MSDILSKNTEDPDALPVNERSTDFIDGVAFLEFVRLKSRAATIDSSAANSDTTPGFSLESANGVADGHHHLAPHLQTDSQIDIQDWDSLFGAVEERLLDTVGEAEVATTQAAAQDNASRIRAVVLDCVSALDKLHKALKQERSTHVPVAMNGVIADVAVRLPLTNGHASSPNN